MLVSLWRQHSDTGLLNTWSKLCGSFVRELSALPRYCWGHSLSLNISFFMCCIFVGVIALSPQSQQAASLEAGTMRAPINDKYLKSVSKRDWPNILLGLVVCCWDGPSHYVCCGDVLLHFVCCWDVPSHYLNSSLIYGRLLAKSSTANSP